MGNLLYAGVAFWTVVGFALTWKQLGAQPDRPLPSWLRRHRAERPWLLVLGGVVGLAAAVGAAARVAGSIARKEGVVGGPIMLLVLVGGVVAGIALAGLARRPSS